MVDHKDSPIKLHALQGAKVNPFLTTSRARQISKTRSLEELQKIATDYECGKSYCTQSMNFDDYRKLVRWIGEKDPEIQKGDRKSSKPVHDNPYFEKLCREFEDGQKIVVFTEGKRGHSYFTEELTSDSNLKQLQQAALRCSPDYDGPLDCLRKNDSF